MQTMKIKKETKETVYEQKWSVNETGGVQCQKMEMQPNQCFAVCQYVCFAAAAVLVACYSGAKKIQFNLYSVCTGREKESERQSKNKNRNTKYYVFTELS